MFSPDRWLACAAAIFLFGVPAKAQVLYGSLVGGVVDPTGSAVVNASVTIVNPETNTTRTAAVDEQGRYAVSNLLPGTYTLRVSAPGFKKFESSANRVQLNAVTRVDVRLALGEVSESILVEGNIATLKTDNTDVSTTIGAKEVTELPLTNYKNYQSLMDLVPSCINQST